MMEKRKEIRINSFHITSPGHSWAGLWTHPRDRSERYNKLDYWIHIARTAERGLLDGLFMADVLGVYDVYGGNADAALEAAAQIPSGDPGVLVSAMAQATSHLGFGITGNLTYEHPYVFARRFSMLDHVTEGRVGWNIVTGYLDSGAKGMGLAESRRHDTRYDAADDFLEAVYKLWEGSWEDDAVVRDRVAGRFTDPSKVHRIRHAGPYYQVDGIHLCEPSPQRTPVLFQAGTSSRGRQFAGRHAECVFLNGPTMRGVAAAVKGIREAAAAAGRDPYGVLMFLGATVIVAPTRAEAKERQAEYQRHIHVAGQLALLSGWSGIDFARMDPDSSIEYVQSNAMQSLVENLTRNAPRSMTVRDLTGLNEIGSRSALIVGSPQDVADGLVSWVDQTDVDGFNITRLVMPEALEDFVDLVVPELQSRGRFKTAYREGTLREKLFGKGRSLPATHPGARFRRSLQG